MRVLLQRVSKASVEVDARTVGRIGAGVLLLVGIEPADGADDVAYLVRKISQLRIFDDEAGVMNLSLLDTGAEALAVSQFTLFASTRKGNRPGYSRAAPPAHAAPLFEAFVGELGKVLGKPVPTGVFGAHMHVNLCNDGPVTLWLDSRAPE
ncbi:D-aminoacyl-tRNA deacylase [Crenobacter intestini]|uniref:D-aminoacyl-tRNA deacylase n=1 Tax=Crenobacter intestini TaxID=2563443 RepID=A0A4V4N7W2_9NEIS|nr:D-aminoacyl-tRNA deacylase [Crenobacter intestini]TIC82133.1 D-tyrosyl-tRNA(Tyr) deacylase [Crenobacter intestini]